MIIHGFFYFWANDIGLFESFGVVFGEKKEGILVVWIFCSWASFANIPFLFLLF